MPIADLEAKIKAVMARSKAVSALAATQAPVPPPVAADPPAPAAAEAAEAPEPVASAFAPPAPPVVAAAPAEVTPAASPTPTPAAEAPVPVVDAAPPPPTYTHDPEALRTAPPPPPPSPLGRVVVPEEAPQVAVPRSQGREPTFYERAIAAATASPRRKAPERGRARTRSPVVRRAPSPALRYKVDPAAQRMYDRAALIKGKLDEKRKQRPPKCTFQPKIDALSKRVAETASGLGKPRHERLHGDAERRRAALRAKIEVQQQREAAAHTPRATSRAKPTRHSAQKRADALHAHGAAIRDRLAAQRAREASQPRGCTFTPITTSRARSASPARRGVDASTRLHSKGAEMRANRVRERNAARKREVAGCSFTPRMATRARSASPAPRGRDVAARAAASERERQRRLRELRAKRDALERSDCSFRPRFHTRTNDDDTVVTSETATVTRTTSRLAGMDTAARKTAFRERKLREQLTQYSFAPKIPRRVKTPKRDASPAPAHERLHSESRDREAKRRDLREALREQELAACPFRPAMPRRFSENDEDAWGRLLDDGRDKKAVYEEVKRQHELDGCTFHPQMAGAPHLQTNDIPVEDRLLATENQAYAREARREALKRDFELEGCTFQPSVGRAPKSLQASWEHESVASSHVDDTVSRLEEDVYRRRAASVERRRSARLSEQAERKARSVPVSPRVDMGRLAKLARAKGGVSPERRRADLRKQRELSARPQVLDRPAPDFGARGHRASSPRRAPSPRGHRASSPRPSPRGNRAPSPRRTTRRAPSPSGRARQPIPPPPDLDATPAGSSAGDAPPQHQSEFEKWQCEMEAKLAAL